MKNGWETVSLSAVCEIKSTLVDPRKPAYVDLRHIGAGNMVTQSDELIDVRTARQEGLKSNKYAFDSSMVLYSKIRPYLMKVSRPDFVGVCSADVYPLWPSDALLDRDFLYHLLLTQEFTDYAIAGSARAGMPKVNRNHLFAYEFDLPPLPEQRRIVGILDEAFDGIATAKANAEKNRQNARALFESHLNAVFTQRGDGWAEFKLADAVQSLHQGLNTAGQKVKFYESGYPIIQTRNIDEGVVELDTKIKLMCEEDWLLYKDKYRPAVGDVFFTNIGTIGKTAIVTVDRDYLIHWNIFKLRPHHETITSAFLKYTLDHLTSSGYFKKLQKGGTVEFVTKKMISEVLVLLPNTAEQTEIVAKLDALNEETLRLESIYQRKLAALDELTKSLLHQAFSGQL